MNVNTWYGGKGKKASSTARRAPRPDVKAAPASRTPKRAPRANASAPGGPIGILRPTREEFVVEPHSTTTRVSFPADVDARPCLRPTLNKNVPFMSYLESAVRGARASECEAYPNAPYMHYNQETCQHCCQETPPTHLEALEHIILHFEESWYYNTEALPREPGPRYIKSSRERVAHFMPHIQQYKAYFLGQVRKYGTEEENRRADELVEFSNQYMRYEPSEDEPSEDEPSEDEPSEDEPSEDDAFLDEFLELFEAS